MSTTMDTKTEAKSLFSLKTIIDFNHVYELDLEKNIEKCNGM